MLHQYFTMIHHLGIRQPCAMWSYALNKLSEIYILLFVFQLPSLDLSCITKRKIDDDYFNQKENINIKHLCSMFLKIISVMKIQNMNISGFEKFSLAVILYRDDSFPKYFVLWN